MKFTNYIIGLSLVVLIAACGSDSDGGGGANNEGNGNGGGATLEPTLASIQANVFTPSCAVSGCHSGSSPPQGLNLEASQSFGMLVGVPSNEVPALMRVNPSDPDNSYLIQKLEGTASVGARMPRNGPPFLTDAQIATIRQWISDGAMNSTMSSISTIQQIQQLQVVATSPAADSKIGAMPANLSIALSQSLDASLVGSNTVLFAASGGDKGFNEGNEISINRASITVSSANPNLILINVAGLELAADRYRVTLKGTEPLALMSNAGAVLDGDGDGVAGGDFVVEFELNDQ